jgi:choline dehydrogenase-like flavoprotein
MDTVVGILHARDLLDAPSVHIVLHANAVHLQAGPEAQTIRHVVVRPLGGEARKVNARHYVLACGAIENARLLLASNDVEAAGIGNRHDQVGRYFMEHPAAGSGGTTAHLRHGCLPALPAVRASLPRCLWMGDATHARPAPSIASSA